MKILLWSLRTSAIVLLLATAYPMDASAQLQFGEPQPVLGGVNGSAENWETNVSSDQLTIYFYSTRGSGAGQIYTSTRSSLSEPWGDAVEIVELHANPGFSGSPDVSSDGLTMVYNSTQPGGLGDRDLWISTRTSTADSWGAPENLGNPVNSNKFEGWPSLSHDQLSLYYTTSRTTDSDLVVSHRDTLESPWSEPESLGVQGGGVDISADGLTLFYVADGPFGNYDIWMMSRDDENSPFGAPIVLPEPINSRFDDFSPNLSDDGSTFYYYSQNKVWQVAVVPEPSSAVMSVMAALMLFLRRSRILRR
ncbi:MAG: PD40 domain-containing protein [Planctomycetales bacterium]|nr:PD40 domain-containing protein [Planctomycetales bacterium]